MKNNLKPDFPYRLLKLYLGFYHDKVYYRKTYVVGNENIPEIGKPLLIVSNHQNGVLDSFALVMSFGLRKPNIIARADVFTIHPIFTSFLRWLGILPAFRIAYEGEEALCNNSMSFEVSEATLADGGTVALFPEAGHQDKRWLGKFTYGYTRLAFQAVEMTNFEKEIYILPYCHHYENYFGLRSQVMIRYGTPIALSPYYERYKTKPRTVQREINKLVRGQVHDMMLSIDDLDNYDRIDFLRTGEYGKQYAVSQGFDPDNLPQRLESDKKFVAILDEEKQRDPEPVQSIYDDTARLMEGMKAANVQERHFVKRPNVGIAILEALTAIVLSPLGVFCAWPGIIIYWVGAYLARKRLKDRMLEGTLVICIGILVGVPLFSVLTLVLTGIFVNWWLGLLWILIFPATFIFEWHYSRLVLRLFEDIKFLGSKGRFEELVQRRKSIFKRLDGIFKR